jgi:hypothetical protein
VGALEAEKLSLFSEWMLDRCEQFALERNFDSQLEDFVSFRENTRARLKSKQAQLLGETT